MKKYNFEVILSKKLPLDIQEAVDYYKRKQVGLGTRFYKSVKSKLKTLKKDALFYQARYSFKNQSNTDIRCLKIDRFPYLIHYLVDVETNTVYVFAMICTHKNPEEHWVK